MNHYEGSEVLLLIKTKHTEVHPRLMSQGHIRED